MDLLTLDGYTYKPKRIFEKYHSLVWTERYLTPGEFQLTSSAVDETIIALPLGSLVTLRDTREVMMVETHNIEPNGSDGYPEIKVFGRSLSSYLEHRVLTPMKYNDKWLLKRTYPIQDILCFMLWNYFVNNTTEDITDIEWIWSSEQYHEVKYLDPSNAVPNLTISLGSIRPEMFSIDLWWWIKSGQLVDWVQEVQNSYLFGIRSVRPVNESMPSYTDVSFDTSRNEERGLAIYEEKPSDSKLRLEVYQGLDRSLTQTTLDPVVFYHFNGHSIDQSRLRSIRDYKNYAIVIGYGGSLTVPEDAYIEIIEDWSSILDYNKDDKVKHNDQYWIANEDPEVGEEPGGESTAWIPYSPPEEPTEGESQPEDPDIVLSLGLNATGFNRRVLFVDSNKDVDPSLAGLKELSKHNVIFMANGEISQSTEYKYGIDYFLGDIISFSGSYKPNVPMYISEIVRTKDENGEWITPGFVKYTDFLAVPIDPTFDPGGSPT